MFQEKLSELRPYVTGLRFVNELPVVDVVLNNGWDMFESDNISYKPSSNNKNYFMVFPKDSKDSIDNVLTHVEFVINYNIEKENKLSLLKAKIEELKVLFSDKSLKDLENLKFVFENEELTLKEHQFVTSVNGEKKTDVKTHYGVELPPKVYNNIEEKEEV
jgi:hypothetical protein